MEYVSQIFLYLTPKHIYRCASVCKLFAETARNEHFWKLKMELDIPHIPRHGSYKEQYRYLVTGNSRKFIKDRRIDGVMYKGVGEYMNYVFAYGTVEMLDLLDPYISTTQLGLAIKYDNLEVVMWIKGKGINFGIQNMQYAYMKGAIRVIKEHADLFPTYNGTYIVSENGHVEVLKYLVDERGCTLTSEHLDLAAKFGHLNVCKYIHEKFGHIPTYTCPVSIQILEWFLTFDILPPSYDGVKDKDVFTWMLDHNIPLSGNETSVAISNDNLDILKLLHERRLLDTKRITYWASFRTLQNILYWIKEEGLFDRDEYELAMCD